MPRFTWSVSSLVLTVVASGCFVDALGEAVDGGAGQGGAGPTTPASSGSPAATSSSSGGPGSTSSASTSDASVTASSTAASSSSTGQTPMCGNDIIEAGEQCDSSNPGHPYCQACMVVCSGQYDVMDATTFHCYYDTVADGVHSTWQGGRDWCTGTWGGDLVVINSPDELAFLQGLAPNQYNEDRWIGATDSATEDTFVWVDGSPFVYAPSTAPWASGEPNGSGSHDCVVLQANGTLDEVDCDGNDGFTHHMCERAPVGSP